MHIKVMDQQSTGLRKKKCPNLIHVAVSDKWERGNKVLALLKIQSKGAAMHKNKVTV